jgi:hypothetical protein
MTNGPDIRGSSGTSRYDLAEQLCNRIVQQVTESAQMQVDLRKWYAVKLGKDISQLNTDECPALLRVMQIIRLLRESQLEFEQDLGK